MNPKLMESRLRRVLKMLEEDARSIREMSGPDPEDGIEAWKMDARALEYAIAEIRAAMGMEKSDA